jgi:hypothetical protein
MALRRAAGALLASGRASSGLARRARRIFAVFIIVASVCDRRTLPAMRVFSWKSSDGHRPTLQFHMSFTLPHCLRMD